MANNRFAQLNHYVNIIRNYGYPLNKISSRNEDNCNNRSYRIVFETLFPHRIVHNELFGFQIALGHCRIFNLLRHRKRNKTFNYFLMSSYYSVLFILFFFLLSLSLTYVPITI